MRVHAMAQSCTRFFEFGPFHLFPEDGTLLRDGSPVPLTPKAFQTLLLLVEHHGRTVDRDTLIREIWPDTVVEEGNLSFHVHQVRKALGADEFIATIPRRGYRFTARVTERSQEAAVEPRPADVPAEASIETVHENIVAPPREQLSARSRMWLATLVVGAILMLTVQNSVGVDPAPPSTALVATPMTGGPGWELDPSFSPDGQHLAYAWYVRGQAAQVYVRRAGSSESRQLTSFESGDVELPKWSPDGRQIAFVRGSGAMHEILLVDAEGGEPRLIAQPPGVGPLKGFDWSPDGRHFAFTRRPRPGAPSAIHVLDSKTGGQTQITEPEANPERGDRELAFSPDGRMLAFVRYPNLGGDIHIVPIDGGHARRLTFDASAIMGLSWTSDGREIVFSSTRAGGKGSVWRISASGGKPTLVMRTQQDLQQPTVSRLGSRLALVDWINNHNIWSVPIADPARLSHLIDWVSLEAAPDISPNGEHIAFMSDRSGSNEIWFCNRQGSACWQLTMFGGPHTGTPRWSPDSRWIAFTSRPTGEDDIYVANLRRDPPRRITTDPSSDTAPSWSRDGKWIYFGSLRSGQSEIWKAPIDGSHDPVQVTRNGGFAAFESRDGKFLFYTKKKAPGLWQMPIEGGAEVLLLRDDPAAICWGYWAVADAGIYFLRDHGNARWSLDLFDPATRATRLISFLPKSPGWWGPGLTVTPDGRHVLISLVDRNGTNVLLVEKFL